LSRSVIAVFLSGDDTRGCGLLCQGYNPQNSQYDEENIPSGSGLRTGEGARIVVRTLSVSHVLARGRGHEFGSHAVFSGMVFQRDDPEAEARHLVATPLAPCGNCMRQALHRDFLTAATPKNVRAKLCDARVFVRA
jgi:hypothetical protein